jgi:hypothetical protein
LLRFIFNYFRLCQSDLGSAFSAQLEFSSELQSTGNWQPAFSRWLPFLSLPPREQKADTKGRLRAAGALAPRDQKAGVVRAISREALQAPSIQKRRPGDLLF